MSRQQLKSHWEKPGTELKVSSNTDVVMKNTNKGTHMFMHVFFVHGIAQIPVGKPQNQAQNELKQTHRGHQDASRYM